MSGDRVGPLIQFHIIYSVLGPEHIEINEIESLPLQKVASESEARERRSVG